MSAQPTIDPAVMEQMMELNNRQNELRRHVMQLTQQLANGDRERAIARVTLDELERLSPNTKTYKTIGKMYLLEDQDKIKADLVKAKDDSGSADEDRLKLREQFVNKLKESEAQSEELATSVTKMMGKR